MEAPEAGVHPPLPLTRGRGQDGVELDLPGVQERRREGAEHLSGRSRAPPWREGDDSDDYDDSDDNDDDRFDDGGTGIWGGGGGAKSAMAGGPPGGE